MHSRGFPAALASFRTVSLLSPVSFFWPSPSLCCAASEPSIMHPATTLRQAEAFSCVHSESLVSSTYLKQAVRHACLSSLAHERSWSSVCRGGSGPLFHSAVRPDQRLATGSARALQNVPFSSPTEGQIGFMGEKEVLLLPANLATGSRHNAHTANFMQDEQQQVINTEGHSQSSLQQEAFIDRQLSLGEDTTSTEVLDEALVNETQGAVETSSVSTAGNVATDSSTTKARTRSDRRRKTSSLARTLPGEVPDLLAVPGIGPKNLEKLVAKGIGKIAELKQLYRDKFVNDSSGKMVEYLQSSVGIVHKNHAERITSYVKDCVDEELKEKSDLDKESSVKIKKKVTICVEGNISVGKSTFLQKLELRDLVEIVPEPVDKWKDVGPDHFNLLDAFYNEPERYAYTFQNYVFATRLMKEQETSKGLKPLRLMERSIFSDRLVFVRAVHEAKWMSELELRIYESWFDPFISALPGLVPDGFIYLRASPDTCLQRLHMRNRPEERGVTLEYLRGLHEKHEQCFLPSERSEGVLSVSRWPSGPHKLPPPPRISDRVVYLEGDHLHSSIQKVPALILDCEPTIDFNKDLEARAEYAQQVTEFYEYIRSNKELDANQASIQSGSISPFPFPHVGGLLRPDKSPILHGHSLKSFDFTRHSRAFVQ